MFTVRRFALIQLSFYSWTRNLAAKKIGDQIILADFGGFLAIGDFFWSPILLVQLYCPFVMVTKHREVASHTLCSLFPLKAVPVREMVRRFVHCQLLLLGMVDFRSKIKSASFCVGSVRSILTLSTRDVLTRPAPA